MRIAQVVPRGEQPSSGVLTVIVALSAALAERGIRVELWPLHDWASDGYTDEREVLSASGVAQLRMLVDVPIHQLSDAASRVAQARQVDVVHVHGGFNPSNTGLARRLRIPYVFSPHSAYEPVSLRRSRGRKRLYALLFERSMLKRAALVVALTEAEAADVRTFAPGSRTVVIPNGVRPAPAAVDRAAFRRELGIDAGVPLAVFVGRLDVFRKGLDVLVRGIAGAPRWRLALIGPPFRDVERLERLVAELGVRDRVRFVGERHGVALREAVAAADVFALPSRWEGLPMALLETLSLGTPAIVSSVVDEAIGVQEAGAGWVAGEADLAAILVGIEAADPGDLAMRRAAALALARRYDWASIAERYQDVYEQAAEALRSVER